MSRYLSWRWALSVVVLLCISSNSAFAATTQWERLSIGAGGFIRGLDISPNGVTHLARTDTYGAYIWDARLHEWRQLVTAQTMPATVSTNTPGFSAGGVYEVRVAPSLTNCLYMAYLGNVYRSVNYGTTWQQTSFATVTNMNANDSYGAFGQKMAVDPVNPNVVYVGTAQNGLFVTTDGGASFNSVSTIPVSLTDTNSVYPGISGIAFDPTSGTTGGRTKVIYASSYGNGVYRSGDGGATWTPLSGGPSGVSHARVASDGAYYAASLDNTGATGLWRSVSGIWTNVTDTTVDGNGIATVITDPANPAHLIISTYGGNLDQSLDRGATWSGINWTTGRVSTDIPWLAWTNENYMTCGDMMMDPVTPNLVWFAEGIGVWHTSVTPAATWGTGVKNTWTDQSIGIEQLVANHVISPPGGKPLVSGWDRPVFVVNNPNVYPSTHGPNNTHAIIAGWSIDYASSMPSYIAGIFEFWGYEESGFSTNGGQTWQPFATYPTTGLMGGSIAVSTPLNILWLPSDSPASPYYTTDGGATWKSVIIAGTTSPGWGSAYYMNSTFACADRVTPNTFYLYNYGTGLYRSTDGGKSWTQVYTGTIGYWAGANAQLISVPGRAGELFFTNGQQDWGSYPAPYPLYHSTDGGATWTGVAGTGEPYAVGFGKSANPSKYPVAIYMAGWVNNVWGIWRSDDGSKTWTKIGTWPNGSLDMIKCISGDANTYGTCYVGFGGSGWAYGHL